MRPAFLTAEFELLKKLSTSVELQKALNKQANGEELIAQFNESRLAWAQIMLGHYQWHADHRAHRIHQAWVLVGTDILRHYQAKKEVLRAQDFSDLESYTAQLMLSTDTAAYLQARLDAKYKHLLIDEFQDTNPIQWQILLSWLNAYEQDESKPSVFLVGDPKQSIYRFRRADVRLFAQAKVYLEKHFDAAVHPFNETRRNSPAVLNAVNQTFSLEELPTGYPFEEQKRNPQAADQYGEGEVCRLPLIPYPELESLSNRNAYYYKKEFHHIN
jgi:ATP-dependent helicase/nuclease subunit A